MPAETKLRVALIGCGRISVYHVAAIKALPDVEIVAVCDLRRELASELASQNAIPHVFTDAQLMMQEVRPDVIHITTPPQSHVMLAETAAKYSAHMYIEKPFATTETDAKAILTAAGAAGVEVCAGHSRVFDPGFREACLRIDSGEIGRVLSVRAEQGFTYEPEARSAVIPWAHRYDWGIFEDLMAHPLSVACYFLDDVGPPQVVGLNVDRVREAAVEELRVLIPAANAIGEVSLSLASPEVNRLEVVGTEGRVVVDFNTMTVLSSRESGLPSAVNRFGGNFATALKLARASTAVGFGLATGRIKRYMGIRALVAEFYRSLREESPPPIPSDDIVLNVRLMEQIRNASLPIAKGRVTTTRTSKTDRFVPRVLVTGGSGFLGSRLIERLSQDGVGVRATTRLASRAKELPNVQWVECDLTKEGDVRRAVADVETIFHCAGMVGPPGSLEEYDRANVEGTVRLAELANEAGVENLVYVSSLSVYGMPRRRARVVDETAPYDQRAADRGVYTQSKLHAEKALLEYVRERETPRVVALRAGTIYGPGAPLPIGVFQLPSTSRRPIVTGGRRVPMPLTYVDNLIDAMFAAAEANAPSGSVYNIVDSTDVDQGEVSSEVRRLTRGRIRPITLPYVGVWPLMLGIDLLSLVRHGKMGTARYRLKRTLAPMRFPSTAARSELGWQPRVSLTEGLERVLAAARATPLPDPSAHLSSHAPDEAQGELAIK